MHSTTIKKIIIGLMLFQGGFAADIKEPQKLWYPAILTFDGPSVDEAETTYRNYRLDVTFTKGTKSFKVPGYFAADGNASETSATSGNKWRVKFTPNEAGIWNYKVSFRTGTDIAISFDANAGTPVANVDGETGTFNVLASDPLAPGFFGKGMITYVGEHYARFAGSGEWLVKAGMGSPEDFFGYKDFDNTVDHNVRTSTTQKYDSELQKVNGEGLHFYKTHVADWKAGDPVWKGGLGKGIIGALNYLASVGVNAQYLILMTYNDDSDNTWPWVGRTDFLRYDVSKLEQWDIVFSHMDRVGIVANAYFSEADNNKKLDNGNMTLQYPIYYREIMARFGYHLGIRFNIGEEPPMSAEQLSGAAEMASRIDPYNHPIGAGCSHVRTIHQEKYATLLGKTFFDGPWMLLAEGEQKDHIDVYDWRDRSAAAGHKWMVSNEEPWGITSKDFERAEKYTWRTFMAGGEGLSHYTAYSDLSIADITLENFRLIDGPRKLIVNGKNLFMLPGVNSLLPQMRSEDGLVENAGGNAAPFCFAKKGELYLVYRLNSAGQKTLDLTGQTGSFMVKWFDPRLGGALQGGSVATVNGGGKVSLGSAPKDNDKSWAIVVSKNDVSSSKEALPHNRSTGCFIISGNNRSLLVNFPGAGNYELTLYDCSGRLLGKTPGMGRSGINRVPVDILLPAGRIAFARLDYAGKTMVKQLLPSF